MKYEKVVFIIWKHVNWKIKSRTFIDFNTNVKNSNQCFNCEEKKIKLINKPKKKSTSVANLVENLPCAANAAESLQINALLSDCNRQRQILLFLHCEFVPFNLIEFVCHLFVQLSHSVAEVAKQVQPQYDNRCWNKILQDSNEIPNFK